MLLFRARRHCSSNFLSTLPAFGIPSGTLLLPFYPPNTSNFPQVTIRPSAARLASHAVAVSSSNQAHALLNHRNLHYRSTMPNTPRNCEMCPPGNARPASLYCEADACYLCSSCDDLVHGANRLAQRHVRRSIEEQMPSLDDQLSSLFDEPTSSAGTTGTGTTTGDYDLADLAAMPPLPLDALFGVRPTPAALEWDTVLGALNPEPVTPPPPQTALQQQQQPQVVRRVKSEPVLNGNSMTLVNSTTGANSFAAPSSPLSSVTEGSASSSLSTTTPGTSTTSIVVGDMPTGNMGIGATAAATAEQRKRLRAKALARFRSKRASRSFAKRVRYECRKQLADSRPRVKGRFVKKSEMALYRKYGEMYRNYMHEIATDVDHA